MVRDVPLCRRFGRLFALATNKLCTVADMCVSGEEDGGGVWSWRRRLWRWEEEMLAEFKKDIGNV